ncbi:MAG: helix-turn-helix domain-containing protein [Polyangiaceae bacterium]
MSAHEAALGEDGQKHVLPAARGIRFPPKEPEDQRDRSGQCGARALRIPPDPCPSAPRQSAVLTFLAMNRESGPPERRHHALSRAPHPALQPFVKRIWAGDGSESRVAGQREHVLPTGLMHLAVRFSPEPIALFQGGERREFGHAVVGGARSGFIVKDVSAPSIAVGAELHPGAALPLFGAPADEFAERHTALEDVWGAEACRLRDRLGAESSLERRLEAFEAFLLTRLPRVRGVHPAIADAITSIADRPIASSVERSGYSHRAFIELFRRAVGLPPKVFARVIRFQRVAQRIARGESVSLADAAAEAGYADQAHLSRDFAAFAGVSPAAYRAMALAEPNHVPLDPASSGLDLRAVNFVQDRVAPAAAGSRERTPMKIHEAFTYLRVNDARAAIDFYREAFGATEKFRLTEPGGRVGHAELDFGGTTIMLSDEFPEAGILGPVTLGGTSFSVHLHVDDADAAVARAVAAGATVVRPLRDQFYGERSGAVRDPFGHDWLIGHELEKVTPDEMQRRYELLVGQR